MRATGIAPSPCRLATLKETITIRESRVTAPTQQAPLRAKSQPVRVGGNVRAPRKEVDVQPDLSGGDARGWPHRGRADRGRHRTRRRRVLGPRAQRTGAPGFRDRSRRCRPAVALLAHAPERRARRCRDDGQRRVRTGRPARRPGRARRGSAPAGRRSTLANFCCPEYIETMTERIRSNWDEQQGAAGQAVVKFTVRRDGMLTYVEIAKTSGNPRLDLESRRAVLATRQVPALPDRVQPSRPDRSPELRLQAATTSCRALRVGGNIRCRGGSWVHVGRGHAARRRLCAEELSPTSRLRQHCHRDARARHRRQHRHLQRRQFGAAAAPAIQRSRSTRQSDHKYPRGVTKQPAETDVWVPWRRSAPRASVGCQEPLAGRRLRSGADDLYRPRSHDPSRGNAD